ncbi:hypothetical protein DWF04_006095 [Cereibacter sphaeroides f. sp. denitrificans]|nr:hypothetical protein DWF04_06110 [Cereibacter sphaeroides f. sp. denitrificans]
MTDTPDYKPAYDLRFSWCRRDYRRISVWTTWNRMTGESCLVLTPAADTMLGYDRIIPCVVPMSTAWIWDETRGDQLEATKRAMLFCDALGLSSLIIADVHRVRTAVVENLHELITCPPMPRSEQEAVAEMLLRNNATGRTAEREIRDHV